MSTPRRIASSRAHSLTPALVKGGGGMLALGAVELALVASGRVEPAAGHG